MDAELTALAEAGAAALVTAMATDLWQGARSSVLGLFRRHDRRQRAAVELQLDSNAALVREAAVPDEVRRALFGFWAVELAALLSRDPSAREPLARLAETVGDSLPDDRRAQAFQQTNTATGSGTVFAVQHGNQPVHWSGPVDSPRGGGQPIRADVPAEGS